MQESVEFLYQVQADLEKIEQLKRDLAKAKSKEKSLKKTIGAEQKSIQDEIEQTVKKRKNELEESFDDQLDENKGKMRDARNQRDKEKNKQVGERVTYETAEWVATNKQLEVELKKMFKEEGVPGFCRSKLFYALFMPKRFSEFMVLLLNILIVYVGVPILMYFLSIGVLFKGSPHITFWCTLTVSITLFLLGFIYILLVNRVKLRHYDTLLKGRSIREAIAENQKGMQSIINRINKDKDESAYDLEQFDEKLDRLEKERKQIMNEKQEALRVFEEEVKPALVEEVKEQRSTKLDELKDEMDTLLAQISEINNNTQNLTEFISDHYASVLGKEFCTLNKIADLIAIIEDGGADTVSEAIAEYKGSS